MRNRKVPIVFELLAILATALLAPTTRAAAQETVIYSFPSNNGYGWRPNGGLVTDAIGNLYGTTYEDSGGGCQGLGCGVVFELTPKTSGGWTEKVLHRFSFNGKDGYYPTVGLAIDAAGNLYGTTVGGGLYSWGVVFELIPKTGGGWNEKILYNFNGNDPGAEGLILDAAGNLYGMAYQGGAHNYGYVFELSPKTVGGWTEKVLYSFIGTDGSQSPISNLIFDGAGNLYGTTYGGGPNPYGTVFELSPSTTGGSWTETVLHRFTYNLVDGYRPEGGVIFDAAGNLYGTTTSGGPNGGYGTVFELSPVSGGGWTETILYSFSTGSTIGKDGVAPTGPLVFDSAGNLYGTTATGGAYGYGTVFKLSPVVGGGWAETVLHTFNPNSKDGIYPQRGGLIFDGGNLYGTAQGGGAHAGGAVFEIAP